MSQSSRNINIFIISLLGHGPCPKPNGKFLDATQCDAYIECTDGVPDQKLCADGLVFNIQEGEEEGDCVLLPPHIACGNRTKLQPAQPTRDCPHQFGLFRIGDSAHCGQYLNCANGEATVTNCSIGLAFNVATWRCDWPDEVGECDPEAYLQFTCPQDAKTKSTVPEEGDQIHYYPWEDDCRYYFACVNNRPRLQTCGYCKCYRDLIGNRGHEHDIVETQKPVGNDFQLRKFSVEEVSKILLPRV